MKKLNPLTKEEFTKIVSDVYEDTLLKGKTVLKTEEVSPGNFKFTTSRGVFYTGKLGAERINELMKDL